MISWNKVKKESVSGKLKGYKIKIWKEKEGEDGLSEIDVKGEKKKKMVKKFIKKSKKFERVIV
jgi:hypothetical protein